MRAKRRAKLGLGAIESLEDRVLLAGDVSVTVADGVLTVQGDSAGNLVRIDQANAQSFAVITGLDGTTLNGSSGDPVNLNVAVTELHVNLGDGNDSLIINGLRTTSLVIHGDGGNDFLGLDAVSIQGTGQVYGDAGNDQLHAGLCAVTTVTLSGGTGNDLMSLVACAANTATIDAGTGNDYVAVGGTATNLLEINTVPGKDRLMISRVASTTLSINVANSGAALPRGAVKGSNGTTVVINDASVIALNSDPSIPDPDAPVTLKNVKKIFKKVFKDPRAKEIANSFGTNVESWHVPSN